MCHLPLYELKNKYDKVSVVFFEPGHGKSYCDAHFSSISTWLANSQRRKYVRNTDDVCEAILEGFETSKSRKKGGVPIFVHAINQDKIQSDTTIEYWQYSFQMEQLKAYHYYDVLQEFEEGEAERAILPTDEKFWQVIGKVKRIRVKVAKRAKDVELPPTTVRELRRIDRVVGNVLNTWARKWD